MSPMRAAAICDRCDFEQTFEHPIPYGIQQWTQVQERTLNYPEPEKPGKPVILCPECADAFAGFLRAAAGSTGREGE